MKPFGLFILSLLMLITCCTTPSSGLRMLVGPTGKTINLPAPVSIRFF